MSPKQHLLARDERQHHPVEVVVKGEEDNDDSKTAEGKRWLYNLYNMLFDVS